MSIKDGRDYLLLVWKEPNTKRRYVVGELSKNGQFEFLYGYEVQDAIKVGFELLIAFPEIEKTYKNDNLFPVFASRLPDPKRRGIEAILSKYNLSEYDAYELLKRSGAKLPIDNLEFVDPILDSESGKIERKFFVAGTGFSLGCEGENCDKATEVRLNEEVRLIPDPANKYDCYAIKILNSKGELIGYMPRYYSEGVSKRIVSEAKITCRVIEVNKDSNCLECIKLELNIEK